VPSVFDAVSWSTGKSTASTPWDIVIAVNVDGQDTAQNTT